MPLARRRRRHRPRAPRLGMDLRERPRLDPRHHRVRAAERNAGVRRSDPRCAGVADRCLRALAVGTRLHGRRDRSWRRDPAPEAGIAHAPSLRALAGEAVILLLACARGALKPSGPQAAEIARLYWLHYWVVTVVFVLVMAALAAALLRPRNEVSDRALDRGVIATAVASV